MTLRVTGKVRASDRFVAPGELRKRLLAAFQANGIEIPVRGQVVMSPSTPGAGRAPDPLAVTRDRRPLVDHDAPDERAGLGRGRRPLAAPADRSRMFEWTYAR